jgi:hypothetical protein
MYITAEIHVIGTPKYAFTSTTPFYLFIFNYTSSWPTALSWRGGFLAAMTRTGEVKCSTWPLKLGVRRGTNHPTPEEFTVATPPEPSWTYEGGLWRRTRPTQVCIASKEEVTIIFRSTACIRKYAFIRNYSTKI